MMISDNGLFLWGHPVLTYLMCAIHNPSYDTRPICQFRGTYH